MTQQYVFDSASGKSIKQEILDTYWKDQLFEYDGFDLIYKGFNIVHKQDTSSPTWYIWKYTWEGLAVNRNIVRIEGPLVAAWDDRASLPWAI